jgi:hypothetical protein
VQSLLHVLRKLLSSKLADTILWSIRPIRGFTMHELIVFLNRPDFFVRPALSLPGIRAK